MLNLFKRKEKQPDTTEWLREASRYFRGMGFYGEYSALDDVAFLSKWNQLRRITRDVDENGNEIEVEDECEDFGETLKRLYEGLNRRRQPWEFETTISFADCVFLASDRTRIWWEDLENDIYFGNDTYKETIEEWSRISQMPFFQQK